MTKQLTEIPRHTIDGAISGNAEDLAFILGYFSGYIKKLATRTLKVNTVMNIFMLTRICVCGWNQNL